MGKIHEISLLKKDITSACIEFHVLRKLKKTKLFTFNEPSFYEIELKKDIHSMVYDLAIYNNEIHEEGGIVLWSIDENHEVDEPTQTQDEFKRIFLNSREYVDMEWKSVI